MATRGGDLLEEKAKEEKARDEREEYKVTCNCDNCPKKPMGSITGINFLEAPDLSEGEEQMLQGRLLLEFEEMLFAFQRAVSAAWRSITQRKLSAKVFIDCLMSIKALAPNHGGPDLPLFHGRNEIENAARIEEAFFGIHENMSFFNYQLIEHLVTNIGTEADRTELDKYTDRYESFCRRRVFETQALISPPNRKHKVCIRVKVNVDHTFSLKNLEGFQTTFASILKISRFSLHLVYIEKFGCLQVTFQMPIFLRELVFPLSDNQKRELQKADVVLVLLCDTCQYSAEDLPPATSISDPAGEIQRETPAADAMTITTNDSQSPTERPKTPLLSPPKSERDYSLKFTPTRTLDMVHQELARSGIEGENYLLFAPSDVDKAIVAALVTSSHLQKAAGKGRVAFIVNATSSAHTQAGELQSLITQSQISLCTGVGSNVSISSLLTNSDIAVCTIENFLDSLARNLIQFGDITLMLVDNFHHVHGTTPLAQVMHSYLEHKRQNGGTTVPQVIGLATLTAATDAYKPEVESTVRQLLSLCAIMDATSGIKINTLSIPESSTRPVFTFEITNRRNQNEPFIVCICSEMSKLEQMVDLRCPFTKWSSEYDALLCQKIEFLAASSNTEDQNHVSILELLQCYSRALSKYMDARYEDALSVLIVHSFTDPTSHLQEQLAQGLEEVKNELGQIPILDNPLMLRLEEILLEHFLEKDHLRGLLVVHTRQQMSCIHEWLLSLPTITELHIRPSILNFHEDLDSEGDIPRVLSESQSFKEGKFNLLITTSEMEEMINLPPCNILIRLQNLSTELALKLHSDGFAYSSDAIGFTVLSSPTKRTHQELKVEEIQAVVKEAMRHLPIGRQFRQQVLQKQKKMIRINALRKQRAFSSNKKRRASTTPEMLQLKCKLCTTLVVKGTDIYTIEEGTQCVAPEDDFREMVMLKPRLPSRRMLGRLKETHKIYCKNCNIELGSLCYWPAKECDLPVLRCKSFTFEVNGLPHTVRKWSDVPIHIPPLSTHPNYPNDSCSDSGTLSDIECSD